MEEKNLICPILFPKLNEQNCLFTWQDTLFQYTIKVLWNAYIKKKEKERKKRKKLNKNRVFLINTLELTSVSFLMMCPANKLFCFKFCTRDIISWATFSCMELWYCMTASKSSAGELASICLKRSLSEAERIHIKINKQEN